MFLKDVGPFGSGPGCLALTWVIALREGVAPVMLISRHYVCVCAVAVVLSVGH